MTPQEQQLLQGLTERINQTILAEKDSDAEQFLQQSLGRNPDATYIMAQTILVQQYALDQAKQQLDQAKLDLDQSRQLAQQPKHTNSFLGNLLGRNDEPAPPPPVPQPASYQPVQTYAQPGYSQPQGYTQQPGYMPQAGYAQPMGYGAPQQGGFLRGAMQTAAGVAAGALAFEGVESLMHGFEHSAGYGMGGMGGGLGGGRPEEIINNNYYGDSAGEHSEHHGDLTDRFAASGDQPSPDIEDRRDDGDRAGFADTSSADDFADSNDSADDSSSFDDSSDSDSGSGDSGSGDDSSM